MTILKKENAGLTSNFEVNPASCSDHEYFEEYIRFSALTDQKCGKALTHLLIYEDDETHEERIIGFISLKASSLTCKFENHIEGYPAIEILELAVDKRYECNGFGTYLINYAISEAYCMRKKYIGIEYILVCADPVVVSFYEKDCLRFKRVSDFYDVPREGWNKNCIPMLLKLSESS